jgi:hypothetical protein
MVLLHAAAGGIGLATIVIFWLTTAASELLGGASEIAAVKTGILYGMVVLVPALATAGATGFRLGSGRNDPRVAAKRRRMPVIAVNGLAVLVPCAVFLWSRAAAGAFDKWFVAVQALELAAGALNITLLSLNLRDGLRLTRRLPA